MPTIVVSLAPSGRPADVYNPGEVPPAPTSPLDARVVDVVARTAEANHKAAPAPDARLYAVATEVAGLMKGDAPPVYDLIEFSLSFHGIIEPSPHLLVVRMQGADVDGALKQIAQELPATLATGTFSRVGVGTAPAGVADETNVVVALQESGLITDPIPRRLPSNGSARLRGKVLAPYTNPEIFVTGMDGKANQIPLVLDGVGGFRVQIDCGPTDGKLAVEVLAESSGDPGVLANFPIWCGVEPPAEVRAEEPVAQPVADASDAERQIFELANADRAKNGLPALVWDARAASVARAHSEDMRDANYVGHQSPTQGSAGDRAKKGGIATPVVLENVARAYSPAEAEIGLMNSPGHRANLLSPLATHAGVGVALGDAAGSQRALYVTQLFFRETPREPKDQAIAEARKALTDGRAQAGAAKLGGNTDLDEIAQRYADDLAAGKDRTSASERANGALEHIVSFDAVSAVIAVGGETGGWVSGKLLDGNFGSYGIGVSQGRSAELGDNAYFIVVLLANAR
jgi:uncharacterized protein YkwD